MEYSYNNNEHFYAPYSAEVIDSRWAEDEEIRSALTRVDFTKDKLDACGAPLISDGRYVYVDNSDIHTLVLGGTGSKKTRNIAIPQVLLNIKGGHSMVVLDVKGELYDYTSGAAQKAGYDIFVLNLRDPKHSHRWNPFHEPWRLLHEEHDPDRCNEMLCDIIALLFPAKKIEKVDPYWNDLASSLALGLMEILLTCADVDEAHFKSLRFLRSAGISGDGKGFVSDLRDNLPEDSFVFANLNAVFTNPERTLECIITTFDAGTRLFSAQQGITEIFSGSDFDIRQLAEKPTIVYIITPDEKNTFSNLVTIFIQETYQSLINYASSLPERKLKITTEYILDEFAQLPYIEGFTQAISAARSRNIRFTLFIQSLHQLTATYGESAETIIANTGNTVYTTSRELPLLNRMAELCGYSCDGRYLISPSRLQRLKVKEKGEALVLVGSCYPYITNLTDISNYCYTPLPPIALPDVPEKTPTIALSKIFMHSDWLGNHEKMFEEQEGGAQSGHSFRHDSNWF